jgi:hypothetical protein
MNDPTKASLPLKQSHDGEMTFFFCGFIIITKVEPLTFGSIKL